MSHWEFKALRVGDNGKPELVDLSPEQRKRTIIYSQALSVAEKSTVPKPTLSGYKVRGSIANAEPFTLPAGNIEYGRGAALHCEECAVAAYRSVIGNGKKGDNPVLGFMSAKTEVGKVPTYCGNCRDILFDEFGRNLEVVSAAPDGGTAVVTTLDMSLFGNLREIPLSQGNNLTRQELAESVMIKSSPARIIHEAEHLENDIYSPHDVFPERKYYALIQTPIHRHIGATDMMCDYHPIYPLRDALRQAFRAHDFRLRHVVIVSEDAGVPPYVMYRDRQHLLEFNLYGELLSGGEKDPPVYLITHKNGKAVRAWKTSVKEWLPFPFTPAAFMDMDKMREYCQKKMRRH